MGNILITLLLITSICRAQENCDLMKVTNDEVTGKTFISSDEIIFENFTMKIIAGTKKGSYPKVIFKLKDVCIDPYQDIYVLFQNGKRIKIANYVYDYNCDGNSGFIINNATNEKLLKTDVIKSVRIDSRTSFQQSDLNTEQSDKIRQIIQCAFNRKSWENQIEYKGSW